MRETRDEEEVGLQFTWVIRTDGCEKEGSEEEQERRRGRRIEHVSSLLISAA